MVVICNEEYFDSYMCIYMVYYNGYVRKYILYDIH